MRLFICGVRGSTPSPGPAFVRYGGNTSSIAIAHPGQGPTLVLDAGTGLQRLTPLLNGQPFRGSIMLSHLHWDHTHGIPFFAGGDRSDAEITLMMPAQGDPANVLARVMSPPHFPIKPAELRGKWRFLGIQEGPRPVEGFDVIAREIPHKGGLTYGYRVTGDGATIAYLSDHSPIAFGPGPGGFGSYHPAAIALARGADPAPGPAPFRRAHARAAARAAAETCGRRDGRRASVAGRRPAHRRVRRPLARVGRVVGRRGVGARRVGRGARRRHALPARPRSADRAVVRGRRL